jgi:cytochrome c oxidase subunit III
MNAYVTNPPDVHHAEPQVTLIDSGRGTFGMYLFIATEAMLFVMLFFTYYYVEKGNVQRWLLEEPPHLHYALPMLGVLCLGSLIMHWGERKLKQREVAKARWSVFATILLGGGFCSLLYLDTVEHLQHLSPHSNAYGSIFYTITGLHGCHVLLGILMLIYISFLPTWEPTIRAPHRPFHNLMIYWDFNSILLLVIVSILYIAPNVYASIYGLQ